MALYIALGFTSPDREADPVVLYAGRNPDAMQSVIDADTAHCRFEIISRPIVRRKVNTRYIAPAPAPGELLPAEAPAAPTVLEDAPAPATVLDDAPAPATVLEESVPASQTAFPASSKKKAPPA